MLAPVILFVYARPEHTMKTLDALKKNILAKESELFIFADGPKNDKAKQKVEQVRQVINNPDINNYFKNVTVIQSDANKGLANSIISGVTNVIKDFGKVIVIEDDCVSSRDFLNFMNDGLSYYENDNKVFSMGGYSFPMQYPLDYKDEIFAMGRTCSYAWATWLDRWQLVDWAVSDYDSFKFNLIRRYKFDKFGGDRSNMLDMQMNGCIDSWAIRFCYCMAKNNMCTIYPVSSRVKNIGHDGSGTHSNSEAPLNSEFDTTISDNYKIIKFKSIEIDNRIRKQFVKKFYMSFWDKFKMFIKYVVLNKFFFGG